jgi:hypothetical protein
LTGLNDYGLMDLKNLRPALNYVEELSHLLKVMNGKKQLFVQCYLRETVTSEAGYD